MARLPIPGSDKGAWGEVLNEYLSVSHADNGSLGLNSVGALQLKSNAVTAAAIADSTITEAQLNADIQTKLTKASTALQAADVTAKLDVAAANSTYIAMTTKGVASGVASLDSTAKLPDTQLPSRLGVIELSATIAGYLAGSSWAPTLANRNSVAGDYTGRWGVAGTGTDDQVAIQSMLTAAATPDGNYQWAELKRRGVTVTLPAGVYLIGAPLNGQSSLVIPEGVTADFSRAMMFFDYPSAPTGGWSGILVKNAASLIVPSLMAPSGRNTAPAAPGTSDTSRLYDGVRLLGNNNMTSSISARTASEIKGFQGASVRGIGSWVTHFNGPLVLSSDYGYIASNWPATNVYGYAQGSALPGIIGTIRLHTDVYFNGTYFNGTKWGGYLGVVTGDPATPHALDFTHSGGHQAYFDNVIFEHFANLAVYITGGLVSMINCAFEECGLDNQAMAWFNSVQSIMIKNHRINYTGAPVPNSSGANINPYLPTILKIASVQHFTWESGYYHNTYSTAKFADAAASTLYDVLAPRVDANAFSTSGFMYTPLGRSVSGGYSKAFKLGTAYLWVDATGSLRVKSTAPSSDTDGVTVGSQA